MKIIHITCRVPKTEAEKWQK